MFMYANVTLETVDLDIPNNAAVFVTDAPAKRAPTLPFYDIFPHGLSLNTITNALT
jgi:hypothetical protein